MTAPQSSGGVRNRGRVGGWSADGQPCRKDWSVGVVTGCRGNDSGESRVGGCGPGDRRTARRRRGCPTVSAAAPTSFTLLVAGGVSTAGRVCAARRRRPRTTSADPSRRRQWTAARRRLFGRRYRQTDDGARGPRRLVRIYSDAVTWSARTRTATATTGHRTAPRRPATKTTTAARRARRTRPPAQSTAARRRRRCCCSRLAPRVVIIPALAAIVYVRATLDRSWYTTRRRPTINAVYVVSVFRR